MANVAVSLLADDAVSLASVLTAPPSHHANVGVTADMGTLNFAAGCGNSTASTSLRSSFVSFNLKHGQRELRTKSAQLCSCVRSVSILSESPVRHISNATAATNTGEERLARPAKVILRNKRPPPPQKTFTNLEKLDRFGRLRTPRAARELSLCVLYAAFVSGVHPLRVFDDRMKQRAEGFDKTWLEGYEHSPDVAQNLFVDDEATAAALEEAQEAEASLEATVLTAPPPLVYNNFATRMARSLVKDTADRWLQQEAILVEILPAKWKAAPKGALLQICILQMALAEIETTETSPNVVVNEAVELAKRFCDLAAPRIINGCLGSYTRRRQIQKKPADAKPRGREPEQLSEALQPEDLGWNEAYLD